MAVTSSTSILRIPGGAGRERRVSRPVPPAGLRDGELTRFRDELIRAVHRVCPSWLVSQSEDFVQVGLLRVMELQRRHRERRDLSKSYLWMVAHSAVIDEIRRLRRRQEVALEEGPADDSLVAAGPGPERRLAGREADAAIRECLAGLLESRRAAVLLHIHGHSVAEIAERMGWNLKRAKNLVYRGLSDLRVCLAVKGFRNDC
jgi:RNA polymerase sigma-70 factor, ECF subfamily